MNICLVNGGYNGCLKSTDQLLEEYWHVPRLADALAERGHQVTAIQAFSRNGSQRLGRAAVEFVAANGERGGEWVEFRNFESVFKVLEDCRPDVVHVFGLTLLPVMHAVGRWCVRRGTVATASFHGGRPRGNPMAWLRQRRALAPFSAVFFSNATAAAQWRRAMLLPGRPEIVLAPEVSSPFNGLPKQAARQHLQIDGQPLFVWAGRLHPMKDPFTALKGLKHIFRRWPGARLVMVYQTEELLTEIETFLANDERLNDRVTMLGVLDHNEMESLFSAADFFVHTSRREHGSNVLVEALSCGAIPVVSNIPSLSAMAARVEPAVLFEVGDHDSLARQVLKIPLEDIDELSRQVESAFNMYLSYPVLASKYDATFERITGRKIEGSQT